MCHCAFDTSLNYAIWIGKLSYEDTPAMQSDQNMDGSTKPRSIMTLHDLPPQIHSFGNKKS